MGSPITFSGFNQIDFSVVLNAIMQQESRPLLALQSRQQELQATDGAFAKLTTKLDTLRSASSALSSASSLTTYRATSSDTGAVTASATSSAVPGRYDVVVNELAKAQVTVSSSTAPDTNSTIVATGGTLTIGGVAIAISGPVTLRELADAINADDDAPAAASIVETASDQFRLVLTSKESGAANAFTIANALTATTVAFTDTDNDNVSGDSDADNAVKATNASVLINNITVTSASNTLDAGIPGVAVTLVEKDPSKTIVVTVDRDDAALADRLGAFVSAYNDLVKFADDQAHAAGQGAAGTLGRDTLLRTARHALRDALTSAHGSGTYTHLAEIGIGFTRTGQLALDRNALSQAMEADPSSVETLFTDASAGVFTSIDGLIDEYTRSGGFVADARSRLTAEFARLDRRVDDLQSQLAIRRAALQREFIAADQAMSRLNSQKNSLSSLGSALVTNSI